MLTQIHISNLVTIREVHLDLTPGATVITGETGAGKSILIDAIELALGSRMTGNLVRPGQEKADISICFDVSKLSAARAWLKNYDLNTDTNECIIRRTITQDGRSKSYINGMPSTLQPLRELSELLITIHGQHEHQSLLQTHKQRDILDRYAGHFDLVDKVHSYAEQWQELNHKINELRTLTEERTNRSQFLKFQLRELEELQLHPNEFQSLDLENKQLAHADELLQNINHALHCLTENEDSNAQHLLNQALHALETIQRVDPKISVWLESIKSAIISISDTEDELRRYLESVELDPNRLQHIEQRISAIFDAARKHKVAPQDLYELQQKLSAEFSELETSDERLEQLTQQLHNIEKDYFIFAKNLKKSRENAAKMLENEITKIIHTLALPHGKFQIQLETENPPRVSLHGLEKILFQIKTNSDQELQPLHKVVSGGELSRISLAIHMATSSQHNISTLIFDEVDVGIGGGTAEIVGKHLRHLGKTHQVLCITHQPQVASQGHQHLLVEKSQINNSTQTQIKFLSGMEKIQEIARMLGGVEMTKTTVAHAKEMLESVET
jgi:DNA repair protein RecN (Recombination protein N)